MNTEKTPLEAESQPSCLGAVMPPKGKFNLKAKTKNKII